MTDRLWAKSAALLAALSSVAMIVEPVAASAQSAPPGNGPGGYGQDGYGQGGYDQSGYDQGGAPPADEGWDQGPPPGGRYAQGGSPPPAPYRGQAPGPYGAPGGSYGPPGGGQYAPPPSYAAPDPGWAYQQQYGAYQAAYAQWAAQSCISQHANSTAAGVLLGGAAGALLGFGLAGWAVRGAWAVFGGMAGATVGAAIGSSAGSSNCPSGYALRAGAAPYYAGGPGYAYAAPAYGPGPVPYAAPAYGPGYGAGPYRGGWGWNGRRWAHRPWRYGYRRPAPSPAWRY